MNTKSSGLKRTPGNKESIVEMEKAIFEGKCCKDCRKEREDFQSPLKQTKEKSKKTVKCNDKKYYYFGIDRCSDMLVGIHSKNCKPPIDVLLVIFGHGGGPWERESLKFEAMKKEMETYYHDKDKYIETFHQFAIRELLDKLDEKHVSWYLTDLIKCYVHTYKIRGDKNKEKAICFCKNYLERQVTLLRPKMTVLFGGDVQKGIFEQVLEPKKEFNEEALTKELYDNRTTIKGLQRPYEKGPRASQSGTKFGFQYFAHGRCIKNSVGIFDHKTKIMFSIFPTGNTSNVWVAANFEYGPLSSHKLVERITQKVKEAT